MRSLALILLLPFTTCLSLGQEGKKDSGGVLAELQKNLPGEISRWSETGKLPFAKVALDKGTAAKARKILWDHHASLIKKERAGELKDKLLQEGELKMPFEFKTFGKKPAKGRSLWISLHGGGGAPSQVNDQQWKNQIHLYAPEEGIYLAPRAPTNTWNLWHQAHIDTLFKRLIENLIVLQDVNPDRVYLLGYSAGGDGVYQMAPRMADTWAAAAMMAGHPNSVSLLSLRNVPFSLQVGANDAAYSRNKVGKEYGEQLEKMHKDDPQGYPHLVKIREGMGHWMNGQDKDALPWMTQFTRNPAPEKVVWMQTGIPHDRSYWLAVPNGQAKTGSLVVASRKGQAIEISQFQGVSKLLLRLNDTMADLDKEITVACKGKELFRGKAPRTVSNMVKTLAGRGDPRLVFEAEIAVELPSQLETK
ncbi:MAG: alpha/beta hydrolase [Gemmataceae bacterium]|nr:alpha/beta hydrolase [Gemmataceae bacterium]